MPDVQAWFKQGNTNFRVATDLVEKGHFSHACYYCHQCVEIVLKGVILAKGDKPPKKHDICYLASLVCDPTGALVQKATKIKNYYLGPRYPDNPYRKEYSKEDAKEALQVAKEILEEFAPNVLLYE